MAIYSYQCPLCKYIVEQIRKNPEELIPTCSCSGKHVTMTCILSVPSPAQWRF